MLDVTAEDGDIAVVGLAHGRANALTADFCEAVAARFDELSRGPAKAIILTAHGPIFSAGVDLIRLAEGGAAYVHRFLPALSRMYEAVFFCRKPVVAAINGHAIAGGCVLACCADRRLMASGAERIGVTELLVGVPFPVLAFEVMRAATVPRHFPEALYTGATYLPHEGAERGWIDEIVAPEALMKHALMAARAFAALSPQAFALTKQQMRRPAQERVTRDAAAVDTAVTEVWASPEALARVRDYVARTFKKA